MSLIGVNIVLNRFLTMPDSADGLDAMDILTAEIRRQRRPSLPPGANEPDLDISPLALEQKHFDEDGQLSSFRPARSKFELDLRTPFIRWRGEFALRQEWLRLNFKQHAPVGRQFSDKIGLPAQLFSQP